MERKLDIEKKRYRYTYLNRHRKGIGKPSGKVGGQWKGETDLND